MRIGRKWGLGLLGIAVAGTVALVLPVQAPSTPGDQTYALAAIQPDRAVQQEATALANRVDTALRRSTSLLSTVAEGDLSAFSRERLALNAGSSQWPLTLFTAVPGKGSEYTLQPAGERYLSAEDVSDIQRRGPWVAERPQLAALIAAVNSPTGQVLAARIPFSYFSEALASLPKADGVRHYLLDAQGKALSNAAAPSGEDRDWCQQLIREGEGFLATSDALFAVARVPSTGWAVVVRHPLSGVNPPLALDSTFMSGPAMVSTAPLGSPGIPKGLVLYPLAGVALLFGLALVGWKQRWPGLEEGPIAFGEHALRRVTGPLRDRLNRGRTTPRSSGPEGLVPFADVPSQLPAAIAGDDVEFLRSEQVRNLRELWSHTEERLSGQRNWVREEVRKLQDTTASSVGELSIIVNQAEQRLEDARAAWGDVQASLLTRIDEARTGIMDEQDARRGLEDRLTRQERGLNDSLEAFETRFGEGLEAADARLAAKLAEIDQRLTGEMASLGVKLKVELAGLTARTDEQLGSQDTERDALQSKLTSELKAAESRTAERLTTLDERLETLRKALHEQLATSLEAEQTQRTAGHEAHAARLTALDERLAKEVAALRTQFTGELEAAQALAEAERGALAAKLSGLDERFVTETRALRDRLDQDLSAQQAQAGQDLASLDQRFDARVRELEAQLAHDLASTDARMQEDFTRLEASIVSARAALDSLEARESADSDGTRRALDAQTERLATLEGALAQAEAELGSDLQSQAHAVRDVEQLIQSTAQRFADEVTALGANAERLEESLLGFEERIAAYRNALDEGLATLQTDLRADLSAREAQGREALAEQQLALEGLRNELDAAVAQDLPRIRADIEAVRGQVAERVDGFILDLEARLEALDARLMEAGEQRLASGLEHLETTLEELRDELAAAQQGHQTDLETLMTELATIVDDAIPALRREVAPVRTLDERAQAVEARTAAFEARLATFAEQVEAMQAEAAALAERNEASDKRQATLETRVEGLADESRQLDGRLGTLADTLSPLPSRLDSLEGALSPLAGRLEAVEAELKQFDARWDSAQGRLDSLLKEADTGLRGIGEDLRREQGALDKRLQEAEGRFLGKFEDLATRTGAVETLANQRFEQAQAALGSLEAKFEKSQQATESTQRLSGELGGLKGRLEGLALAHGRQQEALNAALAQLGKLQQEVGTNRQDPALTGKVDDLTGLVQQLAEQSSLLAQALDANTAAAARTETWIQEELGSLQASQGQALTALEQENAALKASLEAMRETQDALSHRMHMVVQVLSKLSK